VKLSQQFQWRIQGGVKGANSTPHPHWPKKGKREKRTDRRGEKKERKAEEIKELGEDNYG